MILLQVAVLEFGHDSSLNKKYMVVQAGHELLVDDDNSTYVPKVTYCEK